MPVRPGPRETHRMTEANSGRIFHWLLGGAMAFVAGAIAFALWEAQSSIDPIDKALVATGKRVYESHCGSCHGGNLEGQPGWRERLPNGRMPAPPHDASGHAWHYQDAVLSGIVKEGLVPGKYAPPPTGELGTMNGAAILRLPQRSCGTRENDRCVHMLWSTAFTFILARFFPLADQAQPMSFPGSPNSRRFPTTRKTISCRCPWCTARRFWWPFRLQGRITRCAI